MHHTVFPPLAKRALGVAYALGAVALFVAATRQADAGTGLLCAAGAAMLAVASAFSFAEASKPATEVAPAQEPADTPHETEAQALADVTQEPEEELSQEATAEAPVEEAPEQEPAPEKPASPSPNPSAQTLQLIMIRSQDALSTLRELATHDFESTLATALRKTDILALEDGPRFGCAHIKQSERFWFQCDLRSATPEDYDILSSAEAVLNTYQDALLAPWRTDDTLQDMRCVVDRLGYVCYDAEAALIPTKLTEDMSGEWGTRLRFARYCERLRLPFRTAYTFDVNLQANAMEIKASVPRPLCFAFLGYGALECADAARFYAIELAEVLAQGAFAVNPQVEHVHVLCHEQGSSDALISLLIHRDELDKGRVRTGVGTNIARLIEEGILVATLSDDGWFAPLPCVPKRLEGLMERPDRWVPPELKEGAIPEALAQSTRSRSYSDLAINENAARKEAWKELEPALDGKLGTAVKRLVALRDSDADLSVVEAANRVADALVNDAIDVDDTKAMQQLFINGSSLDQACGFARAALQNGDHDAKEAALARLESELAPLMQTGLYLDDELSVYRYFNSIPERISYNFEVDDESRELRLVPDAYYAAHSLALRLHAFLGNFDMAFTHAEELCRIAPHTSDAILAKVRLLEDNTQIIEASELLHGLIEHAPTHQAMALAFYRLAFMEWKLGRSDLSVACYERSAQVSPSIAQQAAPELEDLLRAESTLKHLTREETEAALAEAGIPLGDDEALFERIARATQASTDAELFPIAWQLASFYADARRDDVSYAVYRSLEPK